MKADLQTLRAIMEENRRLKDQIEELQSDVGHLRRIIHALNSLQYSLDAITEETDVLSLIHKILSAALDAVNSEDGSLLLLDDESGELVFVEALGENHAELIGYRLPRGEGIAGWVVENKSPALVSDARHDNRWSPLVDASIGFQTISIISVPLLDDDRPLGVIEVLNPRGRDNFQADDLDILILVARLASLALVRAEHVQTGEKET